MEQHFTANCLPTLVGSFPLRDHDEAVRLVQKYTPEIPVWAQLPAYSPEGMIQQFLPGMPGLTSENGKQFIDTSAESFDHELLELGIVPVFRIHST